MLVKWLRYVKFVFSKKATKIDEIFTDDLTITTQCQIDCEDFVNFCGLLRKRELYDTMTLARIYPDDKLGLRYDAMTLKTILYFQDM